MLNTTMSDNRVYVQISEKLRITHITYLSGCQLSINSILVLYFCSIAFNITTRLVANVLYGQSSCEELKRESSYIDMPQCGCHTVHKLVKVAIN